MKSDALNGTRIVKDEDEDEDELDTVVVVVLVVTLVPLLVRDEEMVAAGDEEGDESLGGGETPEESELLFMSFHMVFVVRSWQG
jgi:hypothetical protein